mmetsp:Transcript_36414/g.66706  ORF Transcript_36414/g.66706 Transcript_36414/m.66706 type:complete len:469 (-) Transcript_36414:109-1515(-)
MLAPRPVYQTGALQQSAKDRPYVVTNQAATGGYAPTTTLRSQAASSQYVPHGQTAYVAAGMKGVMVRPAVSQAAPFPAQTSCYRRAVEPVMSNVALAAGKVNSLMAAWEVARAGLELIASVRLLADPRLAQGEKAATEGLGLLSQELAAWKAAHPLEPDASLLLFKFPRQAVGKQLDEVVQRGIQTSLPADVKRRFVEAASRVTDAVHSMCITPQEEQMWRKWQVMEVESSDAGELGKDESFGRHLHLKGGQQGERSIQVMQDWEWPYMYALADLGFRLALEQGGAPGPRAVRVLEIGWGQGISGRRLMREPELTGAARYGVRVEYEVVELHPVVAADAKRHGATVHIGAWQKVLPNLPGGSYDLLFYNPFDPTPDHVGEEQKYEKWGLPKVVLENLIFYRLLKPGGVFVQYAISHGKISATQYLRDRVAPLFSDFKLETMAGLVPEANTNYATQREAAALEVPALVK